MLVGGGLALSLEILTTVVVGKAPSGIWIVVPSLVERFVELPVAISDVPVVCACSGAFTGLFVGPEGVEGTVDVPVLPEWEWPPPLTLGRFTDTMQEALMPVSGLVTVIVAVPTLSGVTVALKPFSPVVTFPTTIATLGLLLVQLTF